MIKDRSSGKYEQVSQNEGNFKQTSKSKNFSTDEIKINDKSILITMFHLGLKYLNIIFCILIIISVLLYKESLRGCFDTQAECLKNLNEGEVRALLSMISYCGLILSLTITLCFYNHLHKIFIFVILVIYSFLCLYYDTGADIDYHGSYNRVFLVFTFTLWFIGINSLIFIYKGLRRFPIFTSIIVLSIVMSLFIFYKIRIKNSCKDWKKGISGVELINNGMPCKISEPDECWIDVFSGWFDYSGWLNDNCSVIRNGDRRLYDKYLKEKNLNYKPTSLIGLPRTENYSYDDSTHFVIDYKVVRELVDMNDPNVPEDVKKRTEVMIDYREEPSKVLIKIFRDEKVVKSRLNNYKKFGKQLLVKNVLIIYIDALSRRHFMRKMKKTAEWIEKFHHKGDSDPSQKLFSYQFMKYHSLGYFTQINTVPAFFGKWWLEAGGNYYTKYFKEKGAITGQTNEFCSRQVFDWENQLHKNLNFETYDHEHVALFCDPNYNQADNPYTPFLGPYSVRRRCLHGKDTHDYQLEYAYKFWEAYPDMPKVFRMDFIDAHEGTLEIVRYLDEKLANYLMDMEKNNMLDDTVVLFMADHGNNMPGFVSLMDPNDWKIEKYLPFMFMVVPEKIQKAYGKNLEHNEQSLVTAWDIHNTLLNIGGAPVNAYNPYGTSMFKKISNDRFNCRKFLIRDDYCYCK